MDNRPALDVWQLRRHTDGAVLGGVCAALSAELGVDVLLIRTAALVLGLSAGIGVVAYAWAWLVLPRAGAPTSLLERWLPEAARWGNQRLLVLGVVATGLCALTLGAVLPWSVSPAVVLVLAVVAGQHLRGRAPRAGAGVGLPASPAAALDGPPSAPLPLVSAPFAPLGHRWRVRRGGRLRRGRRGATSLGRAGSRLSGGWRAGLGVLVAAGAIGWMAASALPYDHPRTVEGVALGVIGLVLVVCALAGWRRPRLLVVSGLVLCMGLVAASLGDDDATARTATVRYASAAQVPSRVQRVAASTMTYDLRGLDASGGELDVQANASRITLLVDSRTRVRVEYTLVASAFLVDGETTTTRSGTSTWTSGPTIGPEVVVRVHLRASLLEVNHA